ncbi:MULTISPECIES: hypothetical protein [Streptomyces]|uniref:hypothetical protein n=1 Tax=Streptomyces TaxID=1883 RepID=UPI0009980F4C
MDRPRGTRTPVRQTAAGRARSGLLRGRNSRPHPEQNTIPTRGRANLVLRKGSDHKVQRLSLRKL